MGNHVLCWRIQKGGCTISPAETSLPLDGGSRQAPYHMTAAGSGDRILLPARASLRRLGSLRGGARAEAESAPEGWRMECRPLQALVPEVVGRTGWSVEPRHPRPSLEDCPFPQHLKGWPWVLSFQNHHEDLERGRGQLRQHREG